MPPRQCGVVTTAQLAAAGLGERAVAHRVSHGRLTRLHRGVYQIGPVPHPYAREMAAVLATGGVLSHHSAAAVWGFRPTREGDVHITKTTTTRARPGIRVHRTASLNAAVKDGLPLTTPARTIHDLAPHLTRHELDRAIEEAEIRKLIARDQLRPALRGTDEPRFTRSEAERLLLTLVRAARLPVPITNTRVAGWEVDALWPRHGVIVEVDGFAYHGNRAAFERDRRRDAALTAAGYRVVRVTWRQIDEEPHAVVALLARLLPP
jgi:very-short-patch-repair endonuclease